MKRRCPIACVLSEEMGETCDSSVPHMLKLSYQSSLYVNEAAPDSERARRLDKLELNLSRTCENLENM